MKVCSLGAGFKVQGAGDALNKCVAFPVFATFLKNHFFCSE